MQVYMYVQRCSPAEDWGLADVIGALPAAQIADGVDVRVLLPWFRYPSGDTRRACGEPPRYFRR